MATCKFCQKSGWFLSVSPDGLCAACEIPVYQAIKSQVRVLQSSLKIAGSTKSLSTMLSRFGVAMDSCRELIPYERRGIPTTETPPSSALGIIENNRRARLLEWIEEEISAAVKKSEAATTPTARLRPYSKLLEHISTIYAAVPDMNGLEDLETATRRAMDHTRLRSELERAEKFAFKGQKKRACDAYLDALYIIRTDSVPDADQEADAAEIEGKIRVLGGEVPLA